MPVSARLSRSLAQTLGEEAAADMVDWMQRVDAHQVELRELNTISFARFETALEKRFADMDVRLEKRFADMDARIERRFGDMDVRLEKRLAAIERQIEATRADLMKWMLVFWIGAVGSIAALAGVLG